MIESHDLFHEFPEHAETIRKLTLASDDFVRMLRDYDDVDHKIQRIDQRVEAASELYEEELKKPARQPQGQALQDDRRPQVSRHDIANDGPEHCDRAVFILHRIIPVCRTGAFRASISSTSPFVGAMAPYWSLYLRSLDFNAFQIGVLMSLLHVMRIFAPNIWGHIADRTGRRVAIVQVAASVCLVSFVGVFVDQSFWWMFAVMSFISFFWSASLPLVEATTLSHLKERTDRYGKIRLWGSIGFILVVVGLGAVLDHAPIRTLLWVIMGLLVGIVAFARFIPEAEVAHHETEHVSLKGVLKQPEVIALLVAAMLMAAAHGPYYTFFTIHMVDAGYSKSAAGWLWALGVVCEIGIFLVMPRILKRVRAETVILITLLAAALRFVIIGWWVASLPVLLFAQLLHA
jgi:PPP family 3-phenylpropionic acid transporter